MTDTMWALISACWQQDPLLRPHMSEVRQHGFKACAAVLLCPEKIRDGQVMPHDVLAYINPCAGFNSLEWGKRAAPLAVH